MIKSVQLPHLPILHSHRRVDSDGGGVAPIQCLSSALALRQRQPSPHARQPTLPEIFVRSLIADDPHTPDGDEVELNVVLDMRLYVDAVKGKEHDGFMDPDTYILVLVVWSPLPVPCRPMAIAQLDQFMGIDRYIPMAPSWANEVQGSKESPLKFLRTAHWVRKQVEDALPGFTTTLPLGTLNVWTSLIREINTLILFFERSRLSRFLQANPRPYPPPRPRPVYRRQLSSAELGPVSVEMGALQQAEEIPNELPDESL